MASSEWRIVVWRVGLLPDRKISGEKSEHRTQHHALRTVFTHACTQYRS